MATRTLGSVSASSRAGGFLCLTVTVPNWEGSVSGQFALLQPESTSCFLPRAFSVAGESRDEVSFLVAEIGCGTSELGRLHLGDSVWVTGPLGKGFPEPAPGERLLAVGGGVGIAPFGLLLDSLALVAGGLHCGLHLPSEVVVLLGFRDLVQSEGAGPVEAAAQRLSEVGVRCRVEISTEDGSRGRRGLVTDALAGELLGGDRVLVCGPNVMCEAVWRACLDRDVDDAWFCLEAGMACGVGSCYGCAILLADGSAARVCHDGPVFQGVAVYGRGGQHA